MEPQKIFVGAISFKTTNDGLYEHFSMAGEVISATILTDKMTGRSKGYGFVEMESYDAALNAVKLLNGKELDGRGLFVDMARKRGDRLDGVKKEMDLGGTEKITEQEISGLLEPVLENKLLITSNDIIKQIRDSGQFNIKIIEYLLKNKIDIHKLQPREFEMLICELLRGLNYETYLTNETRDGGKDIIAIRKGEINVKYYIECKKLSEENKISIDIVKKLHSTVTSDKVTKGIIATTSYFTKPASDFLEKHQWQLEGRDMGGVLGWMELYIGSKK